ncbi:MAG: NAD(P)-dependent oxidoreductase [Candidatus Nanopelagicales bacterium]
MTVDTGSRAGGGAGAGGPHPVVAITGVGGFLGRAFARHHAARGAVVRGLDLPSVAAADPGLAAELEATGPGGGLVVGDVTAESDVRQLVAGADLVLHTAAIVAESGSWVAFDRVNAVAPRTVALAAREAGAASYVHLSSVMVHGFSFPEGCAEDGPLDPASNPYCASKIRSEYLLRDLHDPGTFDVYVVRPGDVYGPGSVPWVRRPVEHMRNGTFLYVDPRDAVLNHVYVDNLVDAVDALLAAGGAVAGGRPWIVTDGPRTLSREFWGRFAELAGLRWAPSLPGWLAEPLVGSVAAVLPQSWARALDLDRQTIRYLRRRAAYSSAAIRSLGWQPRVDLDEGIERTAAWLRTEGLLPG